MDKLLCKRKPGLEVAFADDLLEQALHLANRERKGPRQASLRRAVSTAYYALFHLLISEATLNWKRAEYRDALARVFEHGKMKSACRKKIGELTVYFKTNPRAGSELTVAQHLHRVAQTFVEAQQNRHVADYDNSRVWARTAVLAEIESRRQRVQKLARHTKRERCSSFPCLVVRW